MNDFVIFACSDQFTMTDGMKFIKIIDNLCQQIGVKLTSLYYAIEDDEGGGQENEFVYDENSQKQLEIVLHNNKLSMLVLKSADELSNGEKNFYLNADFIDREFQNYKYVCLYFSIGLLQNLPIEKIFSLVNNLFISLNQLGKLDYGLITTMKPAMAQTYFLGVYTSDMNWDEALNLAMWENKYNERKTKIMGFFVGNLLSQGHLKRMSNLSEFISLLDDSGCFHMTLRGDDLFFMLPSFSTSDDTARVIEQYLKRYDLLQQPDDDDKKVANGLSFFQ